jgi:hypothetical protein
MADNKLLQQMLERLVNEDTAAAEELFHEYVVAKSREIYQDLIESEISEEDDKEEAEDEEVEESAEADEEDKEEDDLDENFEDIAFEAEPEMGGDATDDLASELDAEEEDDKEEGSEEEIMQDLGSIIDELQAKFDALTGAEEEQGEFEMGSDDGEEEMKDAVEPELETVREYVEKVPAGHGAEKKGSAEGADNKSSVVAGKNDMGGTAANIATGKEGSEKNDGGLADIKPKEENAGNINVPGGKAGNAFSTKEAGHGAEKKGAAEQADKGAQSLFRGRR